MGSVPHSASHNLTAASGNGGGAQTRGTVPNRGLRADTRRCDPISTGSASESASSRVGIVSGPDRNRARIGSDSFRFVSEPIGLIRSPGRLRVRTPRHLRTGFLNQSPGRTGRRPLRVESPLVRTRSVPHRIRFDCLAGNRFEATSSASRMAGWLRRTKWLVGCHSLADGCHAHGGSRPVSDLICILGESDGGSHGKRSETEGI